MNVDLGVKAIFDVNSFLKEKEPVGQIINSVKDCIDKSKKHYITKRKYKNISRLFGFQGKVSLTPGKVHPRFIDIHPDDQETYIYLSKLVHNKNIKSSLTWFDVDSSKNIISLGGPISNGIARSNMGYQLVGNELFKLKDFPIDFPCSFNFPRSQEKSKRYMKGKMYETLNGGLITPFGKFNIYSKNGWLGEDYLVITRIPNLSNETTWRTGKETLLIIGIHGIGTRAIELTFDNIDILDNIVEIVDENKYFQTLLRVNEIHHDEENLNSVPLSVEHVHTEPLDINHNKINAWFNIYKKAKHQNDYI